MICKYCGKEFTEDWRKDKRYIQKCPQRSEETKKRISEAMKGRIPHNKGKTIAPIEKRICEVCQEEFEVRIGRNGTGKCCSRSCAAKLMNSRKLNRHYGSANGSKLN